MIKPQFARAIKWTLREPRYLLALARA